MLRRRRPPPDPLAAVRPAELSSRWREPVEAALRARQRFSVAIGTAPDGPMRDRLDDLQTTVEAGVLATWAAAQRAQALEHAASGLDLARITAEHKAMRRELAQAGESDDALTSRAEALAERHASAQRLVNAVDDAEEELTGLEARLDALAVRALELVLTGGGGPTGSAATDELDAVIAELRAVGEALSSLA